ncbi:hypothetical protein DRH27_03560 [Candidatus Falkowbacteria bacterium]|nr:MAG: hypothetical protein DRH27_03560 [Candidatus Falkowbacteria bacterium]
MTYRLKNDIIILLFLNIFFMFILNFNKKIIILFVALLLFVAGPITVKAEDIPPYYDLYAKDIELVPAKPYTNQPCKLIVKIKNNGTKALLSSTGLSTYVYNFENFQLTKLSYDPISYDNMLYADDYIDYIFEGKFTSAGEHVLNFKIDTVDELDEAKIGDEGYTVSLEDNNEVEKTVTIYSPEEIDLKTNSIELDKDYPLVNEDIEFTVKVKNTGKVSITDNVMLQTSNVEYISEVLAYKNLTYDDYPTIDDPLDPGEEFIYTYTGSYNSVGDKSFVFNVDKNNYLAESDETNNSTSTEFRIFLNEEEAYSLDIISHEIIKISSTSLKINWETSKESYGIIYYDKYDYDSYLSKTKEELSGFSAEHSKIFSDLEAGQIYYINLGGRINEVTTIDEDTIDAPLPATDEAVITSGPSVSIGGYTAKISWSTDLLSQSALFYKKLDADNYTKIFSDDFILDHALQFSNLTDGNYNYYVISTTTPGTAVTSVVLSFNYNSQTAPPSGPETEVQDEETTQTTPESVSSSQKTIVNTNLYNSLKGKIVLTVEANGEAYYINPLYKTWHYLGRPDDAFSVMREQGIGITNANLEKIAIGLGNLSGADSDSDGLTDMFEDAIGTDYIAPDTDGDGFNDKAELESGYNPKGAGSLSTDINFTNSHLGKIFLQIEGNGEAWYVNPNDAKRYFLGRPADAFNVMRFLGLGISNDNFSKL